MELALSLWEPLLEMSKVFVLISWRDDGAKMVFFNYGNENAKDVLKYPPLKFAFCSPTVTKQYCSKQCLSVSHETNCHWAATVMLCGGLGKKGSGEWYRCSLEVSPNELCLREYVNFSLSSSLGHLTSRAKSMACGAGVLNPCPSESCLLRCEAWVAFYDLRSRYNGFTNGRFKSLAQWKLNHQFGNL